MHNLRSIPRIIHVQNRNLNYYMIRNTKTSIKTPTLANKWKRKTMIMMPFHNGYSLLRNHGPYCVLLSLVDNLFITFRIASSTCNTNDRTSFSCCNLQFSSCRNLFTLKLYTNFFRQAFLHVTCVIFTF